MSLAYKGFFQNSYQPLQLYSLNNCWLGNTHLFHNCFLQWKNSPFPEMLGKTSEQTQTQEDTCSLTSSLNFYLQYLSKFCTICKLNLPIFVWACLHDSVGGDKSYIELAGGGVGLLMTQALKSIYFPLLIVKPKVHIFICKDSQIQQ